MNKNNKFSLIIALILVLLISMCFFVACDNTGEEDAKTIVKISAKGPLQVNLSQYSISKFYLVVSYSDNTEEIIPMSEEYISAEKLEELKTSGDKKIPIKYKDVTCIWTLNIVNDQTFTVTWKNYDGSILRVDEEVSYGTIIYYNGATPTKPKQNDKVFIFQGWDTEDLYITKDLVLTAVFSELPAATITYNLDGGINNPLNPDKYNIDDTVYIEAPTKPGYTFLGWDGTGLDEITKTVTIFRGSNEDKVYNAHWELITYKITYELNGGTMEDPYYATSYTIESPTFGIASVSKEQYRFLGWSVNGSYNVNKNLLIEEGTYGDLRLTARFTPQEHYITYYLNGGMQNKDNPESFTYFEETAILAPTRDCYHFEGWKVEGDENPDAVYPNYEIPINTKYDVTLYAQWTPIEYAITYNYNGGTLGTLELNPSYYTVLQEFTLINPTKDPDSFIGWKGTNITDTQLTVKVPVGSYGTRHYEAIWSNTKFSITYNLEGGTNNNANPSIYTVGEEITLQIPTRAGYGFVGWTGTGLSKATKFVTITKTMAENKVYTAVWAPLYSISYELNGGLNNNLNPIEYHSAQSVTLVAPTKEGFVFRGWKLSTESDDKYAMNYVLPIGSTGNKTFVAKWQQGYAIEYHLGGGINNSSNPDIYNGVNVTIKEPTKDYYNFLGWTTTEESTEYVKNYVVIGTNNAKVDLYAHWSPIKYAITYDFADGVNDINNPATYTVLDIVILKEPTRVGYSFVGWKNMNTTETSLNPTIAKGSHDDISFKAIWTPIEYTITYNLNDGTAENPTTYTIETSTFTLNTPTKHNGLFIGWSGTDIEDKSLTVQIKKGSAGNRSYVANWTAIYYISYDLDGGYYASSEYNVPSVLQDQNITLINPVKDDKIEYLSVDLTKGNGLFTLKKNITEYTFDGWYKESTFTNKVTSISLTADITLYAKWNSNTTLNVMSDEQVYNVVDTDTISIGSYPTEKMNDDSLISTLNILVGELPTNTNSNGWTSYNYYENGQIENYMWYQDIKYNGEKYRGVYFTKKRAYNVTSAGSKSGYTFPVCTTYWYKFKPVSWMIMQNETNSMQLISEYVIDSQPYAIATEGNNYLNNYAESYIRQWLNNEFYNQVFNGAEKLLLQNFTSDNSLNSYNNITPDYVCENTTDKVSLVSDKEYSTGGFYSYAFSKLYTDYSAIQGVDRLPYSMACFWTRTPASSTNVGTCVYVKNGEYANYDIMNANYSCVGVVPVITITK